MTNEPEIKRPFKYRDKWPLGQQLNREAAVLWKLILRSLRMAACARIPGVNAALSVLSPQYAWDRHVAMSIRDDLRGVAAMLAAVPDPLALGMLAGRAPWLTAAADAYCDTSGMRFVFMEVHAYTPDEIGDALDEVKAAIASVRATLDAVPHPTDAQGQRVVRVRTGVNRTDIVWGVVVKVTPKRVRVQYEFEGVTHTAENVLETLGPVSDRAHGIVDEGDLESALRSTGGAS